MHRKFVYVSDLHLEFDDESFHLKGENYLILAGDIITKRCVNWLELVANESWKKIFFVPGNHEYYNTKYNEQRESLKKYCKSLGIIFLDNDFYMLGDIPIIGSTLWTDLSDNLHAMHAKAVMNDYHKITWDRGGYRKFTPRDSTEIFIKSKNFLDKTLSMFNGRKSIVITHTAPSIKSINFRFLANSSVNNAFYSNLEDLILKKGPTYWIHGHTHLSQDYTLGNTRVLCNPRGYKNYEENLEFSTEKNFTL